jgi:hypothetical protein
MPRAAGCACRPRRTAACSAAWTGWNGGPAVSTGRSWVAALYISGTLFFVDNLELVGIVAWVVASLILLVNALIRD